MTTGAGEPISPELVLVDPELAARVRAAAGAGPQLPAQLPADDDPGARAGDRAVAPPERDPLPRPVSAPRPPERRRVRHRIGSYAATLGILCILAVAFLPPRQAPRFQSATAASPTSEAPTPAPAPDRARPAQLAWRPVPRATYYLVEVYAGRRLVHAESVPAASVATPSWLRPGRYSWRVFAGRGRPAGRAVRGPIESGWFLVRPAPQPRPAGAAARSR
jgi:hypothetical protein